MTQHERHDELIQRLLAGEDPVAIGRDTAEPAAVAEAARTLEILSLAAEPMTPSRGLRSAIVGAVTAGHTLEGFARRTARFFQIDEARALALLASVEHADADPWFDDEVAGVRMRTVDAGPAIADAACLLVQIQPGVAYPTHRHLGDEWCLFLQGRSLEAGHEWNPGDLVLKPSGSEHPVLTPIADEPVVLGIVLYEGLEFTNRP